MPNYGMLKQELCRIKDTARNSLAWMQRMDDFVQFVNM